MKTMTEILTIPALQADHDIGRPKRSTRWTTQAGRRSAEEAGDEDQDGELTAAGLAHTELIILLVK